MSRNLFQRFLATISLVLLHGQIIGLVIFASNGKKLYSSMWRKLYTISVLCIYLAFSVFCIYTILGVTDVPSVYKYSSYIILVGNALYAVTVCFSSIIITKKYKLQKKIIDFDVQLQTTCVIIDYNKTKKRTICHLLERYIVIILLNIYYHWSMERSQFGEKMGEVSAFFLTIFSSAVCYQAIELVWVLQTRFIILNKQINTLVASSTMAIATTDTKQPQKIFTTLCKICTLHHHLCKCVKLFNEVFGVVLLSMFAVSFVVIVHCLFYTSIALQRSVMNWAEVIYADNSSLSFIVDSIFVCHVCYTTIEEVNKTGELIHRVETEDHDTIDEVEMFSLQIANEELEFSGAVFSRDNFTKVYNLMISLTRFDAAPE
ncbi:hypothetical protein Zmor_019734 [Zophobas morio]|uniref:Gustatory receptor n=1 Tax=Zophobas morio TaxID=2755281 RepID=A0AA38I2G6_9CUCU|nr:hypothetical protein Zmor_019734 [Zophobas morio]